MYHHVTLQDIDIASCSTSDLEFTNPFQFTIQRDGHLTAVVGYFDVEFSGGQTKVNLNKILVCAVISLLQTVLSFLRCDYFTQN